MKQGELHNIYTTVTYVGEICVQCGVSFMVPKYLHENLVKNSKHFFCPNGHSQFFIDKEKEQLREIIKNLKVQLEKKDGIEIKWKHDHINRIYECEEFIIKPCEQHGLAHSLFLKMASGELKLIGNYNNLLKTKRIAENYK